MLGLAVLILGIYAKIQAQHFFNLSDNGNSFSSIPMLLIGVGVFVTVVGVVGSIGAIFAGFTPGRVLLMVVSLLLCESEFGNCKLQICFLLMHFLYIVRYCAAAAHPV